MQCGLLNCRARVAVQPHGMWRVLLQQWEVSVHVQRRLLWAT